MNTVVVMTLTLFFSNGSVGTKSYVGSEPSLVACEEAKQAAISGMTGLEVNVEGVKAKVLYVDGFCRLVAQGRDA